MKNTYYRFTKNGKTYCHGGNNRFEAQQAVELAFHIDLTGAKFEEVYKNKIERTGYVR